MVEWSPGLRQVLPQTHFLKHPPPQWLGPNQEAFGHLLSDIGGSLGWGGTQPLSVRSSAGAPEKKLWAGWAGVSLRGGLGAGEAAGLLAAASRLLGHGCPCLLLSRWAQREHRRLVYPNSCFRDGEARPRQGKHVASSHTAAKPTWAWSPGVMGVGEGQGPRARLLVNFQWHQASESGPPRARAGRHVGRQRALE